jgi:hypothetical protein
MEENNKLIAEFMELVKEDRYLSFETGRYCKKDNDGCYPAPVKVYIKDGRTVHYLKYHSSWEWLMPVVEKIEHTYAYVNIKGCHVKISTLVDVNAPTKLEAVYKAVVEFIKWYNENK